MKMTHNGKIVPMPIKVGRCCAAVIRVAQAPRQPERRERSRSAQSNYPSMQQSIPPKPPSQIANVAGCCHPVAGNVATLVPDYQRCNGCCHFPDFIYILITMAPYVPLLLLFLFVPFLLPGAEICPSVVENKRAAGQNVAGCCTLVAGNVAPLIPDYQRCSGCCTLSDHLPSLRPPITDY